MQALAERLDALLAGATLRAGRPARLLVAQDVRADTRRRSQGRRLVSVGRRAKYLVWEFDDGNRIVLHLSQAGRLDVEEPPKKTKPRGAVARFVFGHGRRRSSATEGVGILVREYGTQRKASWWVLAPGDDGPLAGLGPEPGSEEFAAFVRTSDSNRHLTTDLRDQHVVSGIGRGWGDDILHRARLSPFASLRSLTPGPARGPLQPRCTTSSPRRSSSSARGRAGCRRPSWAAGSAVHGRFGEPCPTPCGDTLARVSFESYEMTYCPTCQTGGKVLADRRLSRLLK